jgi:four helix bundle protein
MNLKSSVNKFDLEERLINFAVLIIEIVEEMPNKKSANHLSGQLIRSGTSPALNYGEAQSGESMKDFIHKIKIVLKKLRETYICLKIIYISKLFKSEEKLKRALKENNELISIFVKSVETAQNNLEKKRVLKS